MNFFRITQGLIRYSSLFVWIIKNRGRQTYGSPTIKREITKLLIESRANLANQSQAKQLLKDMQHLFSSQNVNKFVTQRYGGRHDGGYYLPKDIFIEKAICAGIGKTSEFERDLGKSNIEVLALDPTVEFLPHPHHNIKLERLWLKGNQTSLKDSISISNALMRFSPQSKKLIKMDIEGDEIEVIQSLATCNNLESVELMIIEFHDAWKILDPQICESWRQGIEFIGENFVCVSFHSNNWGNFFNIGNAFCPEIFEVVLVNKKSQALLKKGFINDEVPVNNQNRMDIPHGIFEVDSRLRK